MLAEAVAQITPTAQNWDWVLYVSAALSGGLAAATAISNFVTRREMDAKEKSHTEFKLATENDIRGLHSKVGGIERGLRGEFQDEVRDLRDSVQNASREVASLASTVTLLNQQLTAAQARVDRIVEAKE